MVNLTQLQRLLHNRLPDHLYYGHESIDSTSAFLKRNAKLALEPTICVANDQQQGYGQQQRSWLSNSESVTFSLLNRVNQPLHKLDGLSQLLGLQLVRQLNQLLEVDLRIKWPNDLYSKEGKVAGLLIESVHYDKDSCWLVIGVGINFSQIDLSELKGTSSEYQASYIKPVAHSLKLEELVANLIKGLDDVLIRFSSDAFLGQMVLYKKYDFFGFDQPVIVYDTERTIQGVYKGLAPNGELLVEIGNSVGCYRSGSVSIRPIRKT